MKISTRGRYGLRAALQLAESFGRNPVTIGDIARREGISRKYLHAILTGLRSAEIVRSVRGARGGFVLARGPAEIRLSEVLQALEGSLSLVECVNDASLCRKASCCVTREVWRDLGKAIEDVLEKITLEDLVVRKQRKEAGPGMYHI